MKLLIWSLIVLACGCSSPLYTTEGLLKAQQFEMTTEAGGKPTGESRVTPKAPPRQDYMALNQEHWVALPMERGAKIKLEDGSVWEIARQYQPQTMIWLVSERVVVTDNSVNPQYPYKLTNKSRQAGVEARLVTAP